MNFDFKPGSLVLLRNRPWVVLPSENKDLFLVKPLGGSEDEITGIYKPVAGTDEIPVSYDFRKPDENDLGDFLSARLLYDAARLSFRNAAGPFRCLGKLSFRPRSYQMVPLIMGLRHETIRLFIADDVGVGKTIEALLIAREFYERREIKRFVIICLPHLCDQWQDELKSKFGMEAVIIRSGTASSLERKIRVHENIFQAFPFQIISIDYIKSGSKLQNFLNNCPELIIVDEAHTCAKPSGARPTQQLRYNLLRQVAARKDTGIIMLSATPHSGKQDEFQSLLGLLNPGFENIEITKSHEEERKELARHYIQRRRADVVQWMDEETSFPERNSCELPYELGSSYAVLFNEILDYAREIIAGSGNDLRKQRYNYWDALALMRGIISSPASGVYMLQNKAEKKKSSIGDDNLTLDSELNEGETVLDIDFNPDDSLPLSVLGKAGFTIKSEPSRLMNYANKLESLAGIKSDAKARTAVSQIKTWIERNLNPVVFCRFIPTANYFGSLCRDEFNGAAYKNLQIEIISSENDDESRKHKIESIDRSRPRLLIATDCLSEGINLQDAFNAVLHYDLPWNPNRLEQREGRIDRFGQQSPIVEVAMLYGSNNPIDGVVLDVLIRKAIEIKKTTGISVPFPEDSVSVMSAVMNAVLLKPHIKVKETVHQGTLFDDEIINGQKNSTISKLEASAEKEKLSRSIFAHHAIKADEINVDLQEMDEAIGDPKTVENFTISTLRFMGVQVDATRDGYRLYTVNVPARLKELLSNGGELLISFKSPTPAGYKYIGRNHPFVDRLSQTLINNALKNQGHRPARTSVVRTNDVKLKTVIVQFRVRNVIKAQEAHQEIVAEEMWMWGYTGSVNEGHFLNHSEAIDLLMTLRFASNIEINEQKYWISEELKWINDDQLFRSITDPVAMERANHLVDAHTRVRKYLSTKKYQPVEPVLPMDVFGFYILLPEII